jgi:hypothetical protein
MASAGVAITRVVRIQSPMAYPATRSQLARLEVATIAHGRYRHYPARFTTHRAWHSSQRLFRERQLGSWRKSSCAILTRTALLGRVHCPRSRRSGLRARDDKLVPNRDGFQRDCSPSGECLRALGCRRYWSEMRLTSSQEAYAAIFSAGMSSACVVDIGAQQTSVTCVDEGMVNPDTR